MTASDFKFNSEEQKKHFHTITQGYIEALLMVLQMDPEYKKFNYFKTSMTGPRGEKYAMIIQHVDGPVIEFNG
jgi:hypothetical protein